MDHYSLSPRWLAVPGIGFPQNISVGPNVLDPEHFRDWSFTARCKTDTPARMVFPPQSVKFSMTPFIAFPPIERRHARQRIAEKCCCQISWFKFSATITIS
jgi:hypothetical protein